MCYKENDERDFSYQDELEERFEGHDDEWDPACQDEFEERFEVQSDLLAYFIGKAVIQCLRSEGLMQAMLRKTENHAVELLQQIQSILKDDALDDPQCFKRMEEIMRVFEGSNINSYRHDFG